MICQAIGYNQKQDNNLFLNNFQKTNGQSISQLVAVISNTGCKEIRAGLTQAISGEDLHPTDLFLFSSGILAEQPKISLRFQQMGGNMRRNIIGIIAVITICSWPLTIEADIYTWTDNKGIQHYTNESPIPGATVYLKDRGPNPTSLTEMLYRDEKIDLPTNDPTVDEQSYDTQERITETFEIIKTLEKKLITTQEHIDKYNESIEHLVPKTNNNSSTTVFSTPNKKLDIYSGDLIHTHRLPKRFVRSHGYSDTHHFHRRNY